MKKTLMLAMAVALLPAAHAPRFARRIRWWPGTGDAVRISTSHAAMKACSRSSRRPCAQRCAMRRPGRGHRYHACWIVDGDSAHLLYEDGDQGLVPLADFKPERASRWRVGTGPRSSIA
jgi:hypothetical protein